MSKKQRQAAGTKLSSKHCRIQFLFSPICFVNVSQVRECTDKVNGDMSVCTNAEHISSLLFGSSSIVLVLKSLSEKLALIITF